MLQALPSLSSNLHISLITMITARPDTRDNNTNSGEERATTFSTDENGEEDSQTDRQATQERRIGPQKDVAKKDLIKSKRTWHIYIYAYMSRDPIGFTSNNNRNSRRIKWFLTQTSVSDSEGERDGKREWVGNRLEALEYRVTFRRLLAHSNRNTFVNILTWHGVSPLG